MRRGCGTFGFFLNMAVYFAELDTSICEIAR